MYYYSGLKASPKGGDSTLDLISQDGKENQKGQLEAGKSIGMAAACTAGATAAAIAAGEFPFHTHCVTFMLNDFMRRRRNLLLRPRIPPRFHGHFRRRLLDR